MTLGARAHKEYSQGLKSGEITAIPRNKYSFTVSIDTIDKTYEFIRIANVQMPSFVYRTQTINNYNNKSIIQTGIDYTPITLTAYDTKDAKFEEFLKDYARHYVAGPMNDDDYAGWLNSPKGLEPRDTNHYIKRMIIDRVDTKTLSNKIEIFHPFIANADADTLDYSDSSPTVFRVSFNYEGYRILSDASAPKPEPFPIDAEGVVAGEAALMQQHGKAYDMVDNKAKSNQPEVLSIDYGKVPIEAIITEVMSPDGSASYWYVNAQGQKLEVTGVGDLADSDAYIERVTD